MDAESIPTIRPADDGSGVDILDQTALPHRVRTVRLRTVEDAADAIRKMRVRGAPLIGVTAAWGLALAARVDSGDEALERAARLLLATRPTGVNLRRAVEDVIGRLRPLAPRLREEAARRRAGEIADEEAEIGRRIGEHGLSLLREAAETRPRGEPVHILTHCNAGRLATVAWGTATAPVYAARAEALPVHVWVSETRPRNQGAALTAWELAEAGVAHTVISDNASGHLLRTGRIDLVVTGTDRTTRSGDVANKIGTYMKAVAARDCGVPFYAAVPGTSIDWRLDDGAAVPIEQRAPDEVTTVRGLAEDGETRTVRICPADTPAANFGFDVTPARLVTGLITERGICPASAAGLATLYPECAEKDDD